MNLSEPGASVSPLPTARREGRMKLRTILGTFALAFAAACGSADPGDGAVGPSATPTSAASTPRPAPAPPQVATPGEDPTTVAPKLGAPYPIVLMHGMAGFEELEVGPIGVEYWAGIKDALAKAGETEVYVTEVTPYTTSEIRAAEASKQIDAILARTNKEKVVLVGHSQGGIDARVLTSPQGLGYGDRVASVTTISTPHRGSYVADIVLKIASAAPDVFDDATRTILKILQRTAYDLQGDPNLRAQLVQLSEKYMREVFNPKFQNDGRVVYESYAGRSNNRTGIGVCDDGIYPNEPTKLDSAQAFLFPTAVILERGLPVQVNDGLVTVDSAKWGTFMQCIPADHLKEVGQLNINGTNLQTFDHLKFYKQVVQRIRARGF